jgi:hypothetical protein
MCNPRIATPGSKEASQGTRAIPRPKKFRHRCVPKSLGRHAPSAHYTNQASFQTPTSLLFAIQENSHGATRTRRPKSTSCQNLIGCGLLQPFYRAKASLDTICLPGSDALDAKGALDARVLNGGLPPRGKESPRILSSRGQLISKSERLRLFHARQGLDLPDDFVGHESVDLDESNCGTAFAVASKREGRDIDRSIA